MVKRLVGPEFSSRNRRRCRARHAFARAEQVGVGGIHPDALADEAAVEGEARRCGGEIRPGGAVGAALPAIDDARRHAVEIRDAGRQNLVLGRRAVDRDGADVVDVGHRCDGREARRRLAAAEDVRIGGCGTYEAADLGLPEGQRARRRAIDVAPRAAVRALLPLIGDRGRHSVRIAHRRGQYLVLRRRPADAHHAGMIVGACDERRCCARHAFARAEQIGVDGIRPDALADEAAVEGEARRCGGEIRPGGAVDAALPLIGDARRHAVDIRDAGRQNLVLGRRAADRDGADIVDVGHRCHGRGAHRRLAAAEACPYRWLVTRTKLPTWACAEGQRARRRAIDVAPRAAVRALLPLIGDSAGYAVCVR